jgi:uncharacterized protein
MGSVFPHLPINREDVNLPLFKESIYNFWVKIGDLSHLLFNGLTGAMIEVNDREKTDIEMVFRAGSFRYSDEPFLKKLLDMGYLVDIECDEVKKVIELKMQEINNHQVLDIVISPTYKCNFRCTYCYVVFNEDEFAVNDIANILSFIENNVDRFKQINITWFGGEPLLCMDTIEFMTSEIEAIRRKHHTKVLYFMTTNGYLLDNSTLECLVGLGIHYYHITIDGCKESHDKLRVTSERAGTYDIIIKNLIDALDNYDNIFLTLRINVNLETVEKVDDLLYFIPSKHRNRIQLNITPIIIEGELIDKSLYEKINIRLETAYQEGYQYYNQIIPLQRNAFCNADKNNNFQFGPNGQVYKCSPSCKPEVSVGVFDENKNIEFNENYLKWQEAPLLNISCRTCKFLCFCFGGCKVNIVRGEMDVNCKRKYNDIEKLIYIKYVSSKLPQNTIF